MIQEVCSPLNKMKTPKPGIDPKPLSSANPKHPPVYQGGGSSKLSQVGRYAPGALVDGQITVRR
jgi:hypothetical protein